MKKENIIYTFLLLTVVFLLETNLINAQNASNKFIVVLDAGHGGKDPGKDSKYGYKEKDIALKIVKQVGKILEADKEIKVIYTRKTDVFLELYQRAAIANKADADLFVSVHCNAHHTEASGTETFVMALKDSKLNFDIAKKENEVILLEDNHEKHYEGFDPSSPESLIGLSVMQEEYLNQSILLASYIQDNFTHVLKRKNRGVKQAGLWVMHNTYMPSVLIETGFITNKSEGAYLNSSKGQEQISTQIAKAVLKYKSEVFHTVGEIVSLETTITNQEVPKVYKGITFKVQIAAGSKKLEPKAYNFKGLTEISREKINNLYKYYYGNTSNYTKIKDKLVAAKNKGYTTAFVVAFKNNAQIDLNEALKSPVN